MTSEKRRFKCSGCKKWLGAKKFRKAPPSQIKAVSRPVSYHCIQCKSTLMLAWHAEHPMIYASRNRMVYANDAQRFRSVARARLASNRDTINARRRALCAMNPDKTQARNSARSAHRAANKLLFSVKDAMRYAANRMAAVLKLGGRCVVCGEQEPVFLTFAHKNDDGVLDRLNGISTPRLAVQVLTKGRRDIEVQCHTHNDGDYRNKQRLLQSIAKYGRRTKEYKATLRQEAFAILGGKCSCCGDGDINNFTIHHPNNNGNEDRALGNETYKLLRAIIAGTRRDVVAHCPNCQYGARHKFGCPHHWTKRQRMAVVKERGTLALKVSRLLS